MWDVTNLFEGEPCFDVIVERRMDPADVDRGVKIGVGLHNSSIVVQQNIWWGGGKLGRSGQKPNIGAGPEQLPTTTWFAVWKSISETCIWVFVCIEWFLFWMQLIAAAPVNWLAWNEGSLDEDRKLKKHAAAMRLGLSTRAIEHDVEESAFWKEDGDQEI